MNAFYMVISAIAAIQAVILFLLFILIVKCYRRCPSNRILVIYGKNRTDQQFTCIHGGARFVFPVIQNYAYLSLEPIRIAISLPDVLSKEKSRVQIQGVFMVAVGTTPEQMQNAAVRILNLSEPQIAKCAEDIISGQLPQIIASTRIEEINREQETFPANITASLNPELHKIGLALINVNITEITRKNENVKTD
jgi:flotillin